MIKGYLSSKFEEIHKDSSTLIGYGATVGGALGAAAGAALGLTDAGTALFLTTDPFSIIPADYMPVVLPALGLLGGGTVGGLPGVAKFAGDVTRAVINQGRNGATENNNSFKGPGI